VKRRRGKERKGCMKGSFFSYLGWGCEEGGGEVGGRREEGEREGDDGAQCILAMVESRGKGGEQKGGRRGKKKEESQFY